MTAGGGANELAQAAAARVEQKRRELAKAEQQAAAWAAGAEGERLVAAELERLSAFGWRALHDVHWPGRPRANLDHVLIGPGGVLVIDSKNWSTRVSLSHGELRAGGYRKNRECEDVAAQVAALAALLEPRHRTVVRGVMCMVQQELEPTAVAGTMVVGRGALVNFVNQLPLRLSPTEVVVIWEYLGRLLAGSTSPAQLTSRQVLAAPIGPPERAVRRHRPQAARSTVAQRRHAGRPRQAADVRNSLLKIALLVLIAVTAPTWLPLFVEAFSSVVASSIPGSAPAPAVTPETTAATVP